MMQKKRFEDYSRSARLHPTVDGARRALRQAHESARHAYERGAAVSRAMNWLYLFNHPSPTPAERSIERWNRELGTRVGAAASSAEAIGPQLVSAMQGGMLLVSDAGGGRRFATPPGGGGSQDSGQGSGHETNDGPGGRGTIPEYEGKSPRAEPGREAESPAPSAPEAPPHNPELPYGTGDFFWDFVL